MSKPITFGLRVDDDKHVHTHLTVFAGENPAARGNCGTLTMRHEEFEAFRTHLLDYRAVEESRNSEISKAAENAARAQEWEDRVAELSGLLEDRSQSVEELTRQWREACFTNSIDCPDDPQAAIDKLRREIRKPLVDALNKAIATFQEARVVLEMLKHPIAAQAMRIAAEGTAAAVTREERP